MTQCRKFLIAASIVIVTGLTACGAGGSYERIAANPPPPLGPPPDPTSPPPPPCVPSSPWDYC